MISPSSNSRRSSAKNAVLDHGIELGTTEPVARGFAEGVHGPAPRRSLSCEQRDEFTEPHEPPTRSDVPVSRPGQPLIADMAEPASTIRCNGGEVAYSDELVPSPARVAAMAITSIWFNCPASLQTL